MLMDTGATYLSKHISCISGTKIRYTGRLAKSVSANDNNMCVMIVGIDNLCYVAGRKTRLTATKSKYRRENCLYEKDAWTCVSKKRVKQVVCTQYANLFVTQDNELWGWGHNYNDIFVQFGFLDISLTEPTKLYESVTHVSASYRHIAVLLENGNIFHRFGLTHLPGATFIQITVHPDYLYALDIKGRVWKNSYYNAQFVEMSNVADVVRMVTTKNNVLVGIQCDNSRLFESIKIQVGTHTVRRSFEYSIMVNSSYSNTNCIECFADGGCNHRDPHRYSILQVS